MTIVNADQTTECVIAVMDRGAVGEGFDQQTASAVTLIFGNEFTAVVAELGFLQ